VPSPNVSFERIQQANREPQNWLTYSGGLASQRHSLLTQIWKTEPVGDPKQGYAFTHAPLIVKDKVIAGTAGGEFGARGFIAAWEVKTGREVWRFNTVPGPGEAGHETWSGDSWMHGGAPVWVTGSYDPDANLTCWGTGNPGPDWDGAGRGGDNLYSCSVVALDPDTGVLRWHYQFSPHNEFDWDSAQIPVLADLEWQGRGRKVMLWANRNGMYYVLDRTTGEFLKGQPFVKVNWADGFDPKGRPIPLPGMGPTKEGTLIYPGNVYSSIQAIDPKTGRKRWTHRLSAPSTEAGVLTTASDVLFSGARDGSFFALDARSGQLLWQTNLGFSVAAGPMTYAINGRQFVSIMVGSSLFTFGLRER